MKYLGNFISHIPPNFIKELEEYPVTSPSEDDNFHEKFFSPPEIKLPEDIFSNVLGIWFSKHPPGTGLPFHIDNYDDHENLNLRRFFIFLHDWIPGHIFLYDQQQSISHYKSGDAFEMTNIHCEHAACNISNSPRITMQILSSF